MTAIAVRVATAMHRPQLTRALAEGAHPETNDEIAYRSAQLTSVRNRRALVRSLHRVLAEALESIRVPPSVVIIRRDAVLEAEAPIRDLIERLGDPAPVRAQGMAIAERIFTDAERSPLYIASEPSTLRRIVRVALGELEPDLRTRA
jgi:hypothetical protein